MLHTIKSWQLALMCCLSLALALPTARAADEEKKPESGAKTADAADKAKKGEEQAKPEAKKEAKDRPTVQMAIIIDTSSSMTGLIAQARAHLWKVVNEFAETKLGGKRPRLEVALLEFGSGRLPADAAYTKIQVPLTDDLDKVSEQLNSLKALGRQGGSEENCGTVIQLAVTGLKWDTSKRGLKCIFIAGNESFAQGKVDYKDACKAAADKGVTVSTIFCGNHNSGIGLHWKEGADLADGTYLSIDHNRNPVPGIIAPQDKEIAKLSQELNETYIAFGEAKKRKQALDRQVQQDAAAETASPAAAADRAIYKASGLYRDRRWDLVDGILGGRVKLEDVKEDQLPEVMRKMKPEQRKEFIAKKAAKRKEIQAKIAALSAAREKHVAELRSNSPRRAKGSAEEPQALGDALIEAAKNQVKRKNDELKKGGK